MILKILSWNVNSVRTRLNQILNICQKFKPNIICLQETKVINDSFPKNEFRKLGYSYFYLNGLPSYNGVAIITQKEAQSVNVLNLSNLNNGRQIGIKIFDTQIHNFYIPAGGDIPNELINPKFKNKLDFLKILINWSKKIKPQNYIICGDFNIAPFEDDVWSHKQLKNVVSHTDIERKYLLKFLEAGNWNDAVRHHINPPKNVFTWWSYRSRDFRVNNRGRRLDHIWVSNDLHKKNYSTEILSHTRVLDKPSDHVPIVIKIDL
mgnify:CR=1 FL=1|tara:strand:+ start:982 stop:1770 length:789 start_codon:yes stop_codon:yes gene_type:complete